MIKGFFDLEVSRNIQFFWSKPAGLGQSLAEMPSETLIGENIAPTEQGKVFGSHFAFLHLWWAIAYPIAGFTESHFPGNDFFMEVLCLWGH